MDIAGENKQTKKTCPNREPCRCPTAPERSIVCTETASSSGSRRSCAAIGQSGVEGGGFSSLLALLLLPPHPPPPPILSSSSSLPSWRTERCGDNRTQSRRRLHRGGCSAPHPSRHHTPSARRLRHRTSLPAHLALVCARPIPCVLPAARADRGGLRSPLNPPLCVGTDRRRVSVCTSASSVLTCTPRSIHPPIHASHSAFIIISSECLLHAVCVHMRSAHD